MREGSQISQNGILKEVVSQNEYDRLRFRKWEQDKVIPAGLLHRFNVVMSQFKDLDDAKKRARKMWEANNWPDCVKHLMIKQNLEIIFEAKGK